MWEVFALVSMTCVKVQVFCRGRNILEVLQVLKSKFDQDLKRFDYC